MAISKTDKRTFEIYIIKKIPIVTNFLFALAIVAVIFSLFFYEFLSSRKFIPEFLTFILITSSKATLIIKVIYTTIISAIILVYFYLLARYKIKGVIIFHDDAFEILSKNESTKILIDNIRKVYCNDSEDKNGKPNKRFTMTIDPWKFKKRIVRIRNTADIPFFIDKILSYEKMKVGHYTITEFDNNWH